jgi:prevent-host-death family protein
MSMERTVSSQDAPERFGDLLREVSDTGDRYAVEQDGVPLAAVVPFARSSRWERRRGAFFAQMRETAVRANPSERRGDPPHR